MKSKLKNFFYLNILLIVLMAVSVNLFSNKSTMGINWTFPYFSGAANFEKLFDWKISPSDFEIVKRLENTKKLENYINYKHQKTDDVVPNIVNNYGYVLVALASQKIFPAVGDIQGVIWLQLIAHYVISIFITLLVLSKNIEKILFIIFYAVNPLIIYFTTFPFYYFWMILPSFSFAVLILKPLWRTWWIYIATPILLFSLLIRPTTIFLAIFFYVIWYYYHKDWRARIIAIPSVGAFVLGVIFISSLSTGSPWHTAYVGIGAYQNDFVLHNLSDDRGYEYFYSQTGILINTDAVNGNWNNSEIMQQYMQVLKERYFEILYKDPFLILKNATVNTFQIFSIGYIVDRPSLTWLSTIFGFAILTFLIYTKQFIWVLAILSSAVSFAWYFPPIPAYNFAAYMLLFFGCLAGLNNFINYLKNHRYQTDIK